MKNRYGDEYTFEHVIQNQYKFVMEGNSMKYCRIGGKEGQESIDHDDIGFFDPSGGPFVEVGSKIYWDEVTGAQNGDGPWTVTHIRSTDEGFIVEVE